MGETKRVGEREWKLRVEDFVRSIKTWEPIYTKAELDSRYANDSDNTSRVHEQAEDIAGRLAREYAIHFIPRELSQVTVQIQFILSFQLLHVRYPKDGIDDRVTTGQKNAEDRILPIVWGAMYRDADDWHMAQAEQLHRENMDRVQQTLF